MNDRYYVIAGTKREADFFIRKKTNELWAKGETSISMSNFVYVDSIDKLRGLSEIRGFFVGSWRERLDIEEIQFLIDVIKNKMELQEQVKKVTEALDSIEPIQEPELDISTIGTISGKIVASNNSNITWSVNQIPQTNIETYVTESRVRELISEALKAKLESP